MGTLRSQAANVSHIDMRKLLPLLALWLPLSVAARSPVEVVVSSAANGPMGTLTSDHELRAFGRLWAMRSEQSVPQAIDWPYSLRIASGKRSTLWLYHPMGWARPLSKGVVPTYQVPSADVFNRLLGIDEATRGNRS